MAEDGFVLLGLSAATLDVEYQNRRRNAQRRNKPRHALYGVTVGANAFASSVASGFEGLAVSFFLVVKKKTLCG